MGDYEKKLKTYISERGITAEHLSFESSCHSVAEAAHAAQASQDDFVKNICMIGEEGTLIVCIVKGEDRVSTSRVGKALNTAPPRMASPKEILKMTGYPCGGTPSFGFDATFLIDPRVIERTMVYTGGGSERSLIRIMPEEIVRANGGSLVRIRR